MKKRVRNKNHKLLIKKKNSSWIILNNDRFLLTVLLLGIVLVGLSVAFNQPASQQFSGSGELAESSTSFSDFVFGNTFYKDTIRPYIVPESLSAYNLGEFPLFVIGVVTLLILFIVIYDIFTLIPVFSQKTMKIIAVGLGIVMILLKVNISFAAWIFTVGITIFAWLGSLAVFAVIFLACALLVVLFTGGNWLIEYLQNIRTRRENMEEMNKASRKGAKAGAFVKAAESFEKGAGI